MFFGKIQLSFLINIILLCKYVICGSDSINDSKEVSTEDFILATINYGHLMSQHPKIRLIEEKRLLNAMESIGFIILTNHGMDKIIMDLAWNKTKEFFDSPMSNKMSVPMTDDYIYGYSAQEILKKSEHDKSNDKIDAYNRGLDQKETFQVWIGAPNTGRDKVVRWPIEPTDMKEAWTNYYRELEKLASGLLKSIASILELPLDFFEDKINDHMAALRALNYPHIEKPLEDNMLRCSEHSDYGTLTLLRQDIIGGLQVEKNHSWYNIISDHYDFVVNLGDLMQRWTNNRFRSTRHRVVNPPSFNNDNRRQSMAFFHNLNYNALVETIPSCLKPNEISQFKPIKAGEYLESKHKSTVVSNDKKEL